MNLPSKNLSHLSEEALDAVLIGEVSAADERHLAMCETCCGRLAEFRTSLAAFNQASAAWSDARSNTISRELSPRNSLHTTAAAWSLASVAILAVAVSFGSHLHRSPDPANAGTHEQQTSTRQQPNQQTEIASDNAMLIAIDSKLSEPVDSPVAAYGNEATTPQSGRNAIGEVRE